ncbi:MULTISPECIES: cation:proton antiporter subunit C [Corynebacterium]|uniref:Cation:proton antiporter subunit C n=2 Tax=Corynebacterium TaxID=1716 RepID=A0A934I492_9CORY|nr:cation:proton antiporter subunit C [Corynebacterium pygosceleis]MBI8989891.1 cation:proton antiporter subunit C [Corynebacterium meridianum]MCK7637357.1 cation:proton antiporter subunit C [Corynebacterium pygosceleis]MCK7676007.1 cation:proton antiporter subunit C [Corynebacterium pygosceleis]MCK7677693.1 cation:proton antiporter subunit C [Corynebacterium meridianum]MCL0119867.1 cation:proton antiporter subunit C [Corynebacterium pygosceleis]
MILALTIAFLLGGGVYLIMQRGMVRIVFGMGLVSHAANLIILATGIGAWRGEPFGGRTPLDEAADPLPQAFVLTAIVITMATTAFMLALAALGRSDDTRSAEDPDEESPLETRGRTAAPVRPGSHRAARVADRLAKEEK